MKKIHTNTLLSASLAIFIVAFGLVLTTDRYIPLSNMPEYSYKASSPVGETGGISLPASCDTNYDHVLGTGFAMPNTAATNVTNAGSVAAGGYYRLWNAGCVYTPGASHFISRDATNNDAYWNTGYSAVGTYRWSTGSYNGH